MTDRISSTRSDRRGFLIKSACVAASTALPGTTLAADAGQGVFLTPSGQNLFRVRVEMDLEGNVQIPKNALVSRKKALDLPIKSSAKLDYEERFRRPPGVDSGEVTASERYYHEATNAGQLNRTPLQSSLRESVREVIVRREMLPEVVYSVDDYFNRDELDLLKLPISSTAIDQLLPMKSVTQGSKYSPTVDAMVSVLNLSSVEASEVECEIVSLTTKVAKIQFRGRVSGSVEGVPTELDTVGKLTFDRSLGVCTWLAVWVHENREIGIAEPGFDIAATIKMVRQPLAKPVALPTQPRPIDVTASIPGDRLYVELMSDQIGFSAMMDRSWRMMSDVPGAAMMRMVESDQSIAQCDFRPLPSLSPGAQWTLEAFQQDVKRTLGEQLSDLLEAEQMVSPAGLRVLRVVAQGSVEGVPIQWVMMHFSDDSGRRMTATFTMEGSRVSTFAGADTQLAATLRFMTGDTEDMNQDESSDEPLSTANLGGTQDDELESTGDRR